MALYSCTKAGEIDPPRQEANDVERCEDTAPIEWWKDDIREYSGAATFRRMTDRIKEMCLPFAQARQPKAKPKKTRKSGRS